jgi:protein SCO1/2
MTRPGRASRRFALAVLLLALVPALGLAQPQSPLPQRYEMRGMVMKVAPDRTSMVVSHDAIPGVMAAMTMPFDVRDPKEMAAVSPGATVTFTLVLGEEGARAERIRVQRYESSEQDPLTARRLALLRDTATGRAGGARRPTLTVGQVVPDVPLVDQLRRPTVLSRFRGQVVALNFIYTSCALPQFCFRIANQFGVLQRRFQERLGKDLILLTTTFDPARDQPEVLAEYAKQWNANAETWRFLSGTAADIRTFTGFGVEFFQDEGLMNHSVHTVVIDRDGRVVANVEGNQHTAAQIGDLVQTVLANR